LGQPTPKAIGQNLWKGIVSIQNMFNISHRPDEDVVKYCEEEEGLAFIPWFPIAGGALDQRGGKLDQAAGRHNGTLSQISIAWLLHHSPVILPMPGTSSLQGAPHERDFYVR
jgi:aryl-alcohol dehydrogenase-like predicted oxidoreductase